MRVLAGGSRTAMRPRERETEARRARRAKWPQHELRTLALVRLIVRWPLWEEAGLGEDESMDAAKLRPAGHRRRPASDGSQRASTSRQPRMAVSLSRPAPKDGLSSAAARSKFHLSRPKQEGKGSSDEYECS